MIAHESVEVIEVGRGSRAVRGLYLAEGSLLNLGRRISKMGGLYIVSPDRFIGTGLFWLIT